MDRRQRKTREAIFKAFTELLSKKRFEQITVAEIIDAADVGRATFYSHFETKEYLLKEMCRELFCHITDKSDGEENGHKHIFECDVQEDVFLHLFRHLYRNDNNIMKLMACKSNELFLKYFKNELRTLAENSPDLFEMKKNPALPDGFWINHVVSVFAETVEWWVGCGIKETPETIAEYFYMII